MFNLRDGLEKDFSILSSCAKFSCNPVIQAPAVVQKVNNAVQWMCFS